MRVSVEAYFLLNLGWDALLLAIVSRQSRPRPLRILAAAALVDLVLLMVVMRQQAGSLEALSTVAETDVDRLMEFTRPGQAVGIGGAFSLIFVAPLVLLYNYTRVPKNKIIGMLVPAAGILLIILALLEGFHQGLGYLPFERWDFREIIRVLSSE